MMRVPKIEDFRQKCILCDATDDLILHHKRYGSNLTKNDFVVLCRPCHTKYHIGGLNNDVIKLCLAGQEIGYVFKGVITICNLCIKQATVSIFDIEEDFMKHFTEKHTIFKEGKTDELKQNLR